MSRDGSTMRRRGSVRVAAVVVALVLSAVLLESGARIFWRMAYGVPLTRPGRALWAVYPELWQLGWKDEDVRGANPVRVLLLSGSALHPEWGNVEQELRERLTVRLSRPIIVYNMAAIGHTSRDSYIKYRALAGRHFDLVIFYHGINDARANNVPPEKFRADYSHYAWYDVVNALDSCREHPWTVLPCTLRYLTVRASDRLGLVRYVSMDAPRPEWLGYGAEVKSAVSFETNLRGIVETAHARREPLLLMTFATYVPGDYSLAAFKQRKLDYTLSLSPIEMWGAPEAVIQAIARHNDIVRRIAASDATIRFVDQATAMPKGGRYFNDVCHLTSAGSTVFVENLLEEAARAATVPTAR